MKNLAVSAVSPRATPLQRRDPNSEIWEGGQVKNLILLIVSAPLASLTVILMVDDKRARYARSSFLSTVCRMPPLR